MKFYVINLERRPDRKEDLIQRFPLNNSLNFTNAIDAKNDGLYCALINDNNDYDNNPPVYAATMSHINVWKQIAEGNDDYGIILEDDVLFSPKFVELWKSVSSRIKKIFERDMYDIVYLGCGDVLPEHTNVPNLSLLNAQQSAHVIKPVRHKYFGHFNMNSAYVFDWLAAFSYCLSKQSAIRLLKLAETTPMNKAVDVWLKETIPEDRKVVTVPLLTYHPPYGTRDSDILNRMKLMV